MKILPLPMIARRAWGWLWLAMVISLFLVHGVGRAEIPAQVSPLETPTETPFFFPTETSFPVIIESPSETPAVPALQETPTLENVFPGEVTPFPAETPTPLLLLPPVDRPIVVVEPTPAPQPGDLIAVVLGSVARATGWIWFACGSLIFFIVAGIVGGLYLSHQYRNRYQIYTLVPDERAETFLQTSEDAPKRAVQDDDIWPASLP